MNSFIELMFQFYPSHKKIHNRTHKNVGLTNLIQSVGIWSHEPQAQFSVAGHFSESLFDAFRS